MSLEPAPLAPSDGLELNPVPGSVSAELRSCKRTEMLPLFVSICLQTAVLKMFELEVNRHFVFSAIRAVFVVSHCEATR